MNYELHIASGTRADWGLLQPLVLRLREEGAKVSVMATHQHLIPEMGNTIEEIIADGFTPAVCLPAEGSPAEIMAQAAAGAAKFFAENKADGGSEGESKTTPDAIIILGDRCEMLGIASAALLSGIPIIHIAGGTISEGAFDDSVRHAISKMATLHFPETDACARRLIQMGEDPASVHPVGAIGVENSLNIPKWDLRQLADSLEWPELLENNGDTQAKDAASGNPEAGDPTNSGFLVVTLHAATLEARPPLEIQQNMLSALESLPENIKFLITYPNCDTDPTPLIESLRDFERANPGRVKVIPSLGRVRYLSAVALSRGVVGNSSSGLVEVPSLGVPTLDIGIRQKGRECGPSVTHCGISREEIAAGLQRILSPEIQSLARRRENPYARPATTAAIARTILSTPFSPYPKKKFRSPLTP